MTILAFRLIGVPPENALKEIRINTKGNITDIKKLVIQEYKLNPVLPIQFILKGSILSNNTGYNDLRFFPKKDVIAVMTKQVGAVSRLEMVLQELNTNGNFRASLFSTSTGLVLASQKSDDSLDDRVVAAMGTLLSDAAINAAEEMNLSEVQVMKIYYKEDYIICRNIIMPEGDTKFLLAVLSKSPESDDVEKYFDQLLNWAVENSQADLEKLSSL